MNALGIGLTGVSRWTASFALAAAMLLLVTPRGAPADVTAAVPAAGGCAAATTVPTNPAMRVAAAGAVLCLINVERSKRALPALAASSLLERAAAFHSVDMVRRKYFSHVSPNGQDMIKRVARTGYLRGARRPLLGETIAWGSDLFASPAELVNELIASAVHKAIILDGRYRDIGVGLVLGSPMDDMGDAASTLSLNFGRR